MSDSMRPEQIEITPEDLGLGTAEVMPLVDEIEVLLEEIDAEGGGFKHSGSLVFWMTSLSRPRLLIAGVLAVLAVAVLAVVAMRALDEADNDLVTTASVPVNVALHSSDAPVVNEEITLSLIVSAKEDVEDLQLQLRPPEGTVEGENVWRGNLAQGQEVELSVRWIPLEEGIFTAYGIVSGRSLPDTDKEQHLFFKVTNDSLTASVSTEPFLPDGYEEGYEVMVSQELVE